MANEENDDKKTRIQVSEETALKLQSMRASLSEEYDDVIKRLIKESEKKK